MVTVAVAQLDIRRGEAARNKERLLSWAGRVDADLLVFPECANAGYAFSSRGEALPHAEPVPGPFTEALQELAAGRRIAVAVGVLEREGAALRNSAVLVTPERALHVYRKTHLPYLGVDRFVVPGDELPVFATPLGTIGMAICYEWRFPEVARSLSLGGADLLLGLSNWPEGAMVTPRLLLPARAAENRVWIASANRVGAEGGNTFIGRSAILSPFGDAVAEAVGPSEEVVSHRLDLSLSRGKRTVNAPGEYEIDLFADRRPQLYGALTRGTADD